MKRYAFTLPQPPSANRWWRNYRGRMVTSQAARDYGASASKLAHAQGVRVIRRPAQVKLTLVWYRSRKAGDLDKRLGILLDALQGIAYENDSQVTRIEATRSDADTKNGRIEVTVEELAA